MGELKISVTATTQKSRALLFFEKLEAEGLKTSPQRNGVARGIETLTNDADMRLLYDGYREWLTTASDDPTVRADPAPTAQSWMIEYARTCQMAYTPNFRTVFE